ncbi:MAG: MerR family transcriptional regulator, partial [Chloroflexi bacterium RBG_16_56_8]
MYTVKQLSDMAGVTPRTLHHYDQIGLLKPSAVGGNGYRYYEEEALYRLQQILFYRELDLPLDNIKKIMGRRDFDVLSALQSHRFALQGQVERLNRLIQTVDKTILHLKGEQKMSPKNLFDGFTEEEQNHYEAQAMQMYDPETVKASNRKWKDYSAAEKEKIGAEGQAIYQDMIAAMDKSAEAPEVQVIVGRWRKHIEYFWLPDNDQLLGLADLYNTSPDFFQKFEATKPGLAAFMKEAIA